MEVSGPQVVARSAARKQPLARRASPASGSSCNADLRSDQLGEGVQEGLEAVAEAKSWGGIDANVVDGELHGGSHGVGVEEGDGFGYTKVLGYHPLLATRADTGEVLHARMRKGSANTARGVRASSTRWWLGCAGPGPPARS